MQEFHECPYCALDLEQWSLRFSRGDAVTAGRHREAGAARFDDLFAGTQPAPDTATETEGLTLLSLCPSERCGYYALRYRNGLSHWDRDVEAARLLRTIFGDAS